MNLSGVKKELYKKCSQLISDKLEQLHHAYSETREALLSESKSTAGDKHETGRAMIQLEQEKMGRQLQETEKLKNMLERVPFQQTFEKVQSGALLQANDDLYFIAVGLGKVDVEGLEVFVIAPTSPLAQVFLGKEKGFSVKFQDRLLRIESIC